MTYPIILNGDHAEFEREHADTPPKERPDWPLPSFDARDWAEAFNAVLVKQGHQPFDPGFLVGWFANALMRGYDEPKRTASDDEQREHCECPKCGRNHWKLANNPPSAITTA